MKKKSIILVLIIIFLLCFLGINNKNNKEEPIINTNKLIGTIISISNNKITIQDKNNIIYSFNKDFPKSTIGTKVEITYEGKLNKNQENQNINIKEINIVPITKNEDNIPNEWLDEGILSKYYSKAYNKIKNMTIEEKIGQLLLVRYPNDNQIEIAINNNLGGYIFFEKDFINKTENEVKEMINSIQEKAKIPLLTAVDEEGGRVVRISSNKNLVSERFKSSRVLYLTGGFELIKEDTINKSNILSNLGINVNLAPVVDISTNENDYMYYRTIGEDAKITSKYAKTVINASKKGNVSYVLKHFPGYGNNVDTHNNTAIDNRSYESILNNDLKPFKSGINANAEAILVSHNIVTSIDNKNIASLSPSIHNLLRNELNFTGIIITDDLYMDAASKIENASLKAILSGNDLIITTNYENSINEIKKALDNNEIDESLINKLALRNIAWKYYKGLIK